jgi:AcrR family transcriptional regulator
MQSRVSTNVSQVAFETCRTSSTGYDLAMATRGSLRQRKKDQTRAAIFEAAIDLFRSQGYEQTTIDQIAETANYSRATFHRYFASKEDVLFGDSEQYLERLKDALAAAHGTADPWQVVRNAVTDQVTAFATNDPDMYTLALELWFTLPAYNRRISVNMAWEDAVTEFLVRERRTRPDTDIHSRVWAAMMIGAVRAAMQSAYAGGPRLEDAIREAFRVLEAVVRVEAMSGRAWMIDADGGAPSFGDRIDGSSAPDDLEAAQPAID